MKIDDPLVWEGVILGLTVLGAALVFARAARPGKAALLTKIRSGLMFVYMLAYNIRMWTYEKRRLRQGRAE